MHKIEFKNHISFSKFIIIQLVIILFTILITYKWAFTFTNVIEQNFLINIMYGLIGLSALLLIHKAIHKFAYFIFLKGDKLCFDYKKGILMSASTDKYLNIYQYTIAMMAPLVMITLGLLIVFTYLPYSSIIFMSSMHIGYCLIDSYLVGLAIFNKFKYIQSTQEGLYMYHYKPLQLNNEFES